MINRTLVRTKVVQTLFAYFKNSDSTPFAARKQLTAAFADTYALYLMMLNFAGELTSYAEAQIQSARERAMVTHKDYAPNLRFVNSRIAQQLFNHSRLRSLTEEHHLDWRDGYAAVQDIYRSLIESNFYQTFMALDNPGYEDEKLLWRKIYSKLIPNSDAMIAVLEDMEVHNDHIGWTTDLDIVLSYVGKTIRRFEDNDAVDQPLQEIFDTEDERLFAEKLLLNAIDNADLYRSYINAHLKNWDPDRIAYMDTIILITALTEILTCSEIAIEVSMNEYIDLAKEFSGDKNYQFINGILTEIIHDLNANGQLLKIIR